MEFRIVEDNKDFVVKSKKGFFFRWKFMRDKNGNIKTFSSRKGAQAFINLQKINR